MQSVLGTPSLLDETYQHHFSSGSDDIARLAYLYDQSDLDAQLEFLELYGQALLAYHRDQLIATLRYGDITLPPPVVPFVKSALLQDITNHQVGSWMQDLADPLQPDRWKLRHKAEDTYLVFEIVEAEDRYLPEIGIKLFDTDRRAIQVNNNWHQTLNLQDHLSHQQDIIATDAVLDTLSPASLSTNIIRSIWHDLSEICTTDTNHGTKSPTFEQFEQATLQAIITSDPNLSHHHRHTLHGLLGYKSGLPDHAQHRFKRREYKEFPEDSIAFRKAASTGTPHYHQPSALVRQATHRWPKRFQGLDPEIHPLLVTSPDDDSQLLHIHDLPSIRHHIRTMLPEMYTNIDYCRQRVAHLLTLPRLAGQYDHRTLSDAIDSTQAELDQLDTRTTNFAQI